MTAAKIDVKNKIDLEGKPHVFLMAVLDLLKSGKKIDLYQFSIERYCCIENGDVNEIYDKIIKILKKCNDCEISIIVKNDQDKLPSVSLINNNLGFKHPKKSFTISFNEIGEIEHFNVNTN